MKANERKKKTKLWIGKRRSGSLSRKKKLIFACIFLHWEFKFETNFVSLCINVWSILMHRRQVYCAIWFLFANIFTRRRSRVWKLNIWSSDSLTSISIAHCASIETETTERRVAKPNRWYRRFCLKMEIFSWAKNTFVSRFIYSRLLMERSSFNF